MQPDGALERPAPMIIRPALRAAMGLLLALAALGAPTASVLACSCASLGAGPADVARSAAANGGIGFVGTVVAARPAPPDPNGIGDVVAYAFEVERATAPVSATIEVRALNDPGGAACGFVFGVDEEWFVAASPEGSALHTNLCSDNRPVAEIEPAEMERLIEALPEQPVPRNDHAGGGLSPASWLPIGAVVGIVVVITGVMAVAFRRRDVS